MKIMNDLNNKSCVIGVNHPDHLGSTNFVTDIDGNAVQFTSYIPYGEVFVEERNTSFSSSYLFNAKELDNETGLYYYGARYLDPQNASWLSVDPLWEKYPGISPYSYCVGNPVRLVDPDGRDLSINVDGETYVYNSDKVDNRYDGKNKIIKGFVTSLNKMNSTKIGNKLLSDLCNSEKKYTISNLVSKGGAGTRSTLKTTDGIVNKMGNESNLLELSHELFHSYQYEKGQGGPSVFNEVEAYVYSNRLVNEYNENIPYDHNFYENYENNDSFVSSNDFMIGNSLSNGALKYENSANSLVNGKSFSPTDFNVVWKNFIDCSSMNSSGIYNSKHYKFSLSENKRYLLSPFYK